MKGLFSLACKQTGGFKPPYWKAYRLARREAATATIRCFSSLRRGRAGYVWRGMVKRDMINSAIIVIILSHFTALVWSTGDKKELLKYSNTDKRGFLRYWSIFVHHIYMYVGLELQAQGH